MRKDFEKVINEPARGGVAYYRGLPNGYRNAKKIELDEDYDVVDEYGTHSSMTSKRVTVGYNGKDKQFNFRVIRKFLVKQVGRKWNDVFAEVSGIIKHGITGNHSSWKNAAELVKNEVETNTYIDDDGDIAFDSKYAEVGVKIKDRSEQLYVDPNTGILCKSKRLESYRQVIRRRREEEQAKLELVRRIISKTIQYHKVDNVWYQVTVVPVPPEVYAGLVAHDVLGPFLWNNKLYNISSRYLPVSVNSFLIQRYGDVLWGVKKRTASKSEIRKYKLK